MRTVREVILLAHEWIHEYQSQVPGFAGAYFYGGITLLPQDAIFPAYRDVDIVIVTTKGKRPDSENLELDYHGLMIEVGFLGTEEHGSPEAVLANPELAPNFVNSPLLADPLNLLRPLQEIVIQQFAQERWIRARCDEEKERIYRSLEAIGAAQTGAERIGSLLNYLNNCTGLLALACLRKPTHRRTLTLLKELVSAQGNQELHEEALRLFGMSTISRERVSELLQEAGHAFDRAVIVRRSPSPYDFKLRTHLRPYFVEASQEIIDEGDFREATFWIVACYVIAYLALMNDASLEEQATFHTAWTRVVDEMGLSAPTSSLERQEAAKSFAQSIFSLADTLIVENGNSSTA